MKKIFIAIAFLIATTVTPRITMAQIPVLSLIKQVVVKIIKAIDLEIQRQQNKVIWLQNAQKTLENTMSKLKLNEISDWTEKQRKLYADYFDELRKVKDAISTYNRVKEILTRQKQLVDEYTHAWSLLKQDSHFSPQELDHMSSVYSGILNESLQNIEELQLAVTSFTMQMSDGKRMELIRKVSEHQDKNISDLHNFNTHNMQISVFRAKNASEVQTLKKLYGL